MLYLTNNGDFQCDQLFFDVLLMEMRGKTIAYTSYKKKIEINREKVLLEEINKLEKEAVLNFELLDKKRNELQDIRNKNMEGVKTRSRLRSISNVENATKYFCSLEKRNFISKCMNSLIKENGSTTYVQSELLQETIKSYIRFVNFG